MQTTSNIQFLRETLVVIPALNEAPCVAGTIAGWQALGALHVRVVDNGSVDGTPEIARGAGAEITKEARRGYGAAAWRGLQDWPDELKWVLFSSADGSDRLALEELPAWQSALDAGAQLVVGDRVTLRESRAHLNLGQRFGNWLTCQVITAGWGRRFRDMGSLRLADRTALVQLELKDRAFGWNVEMQVRAVEQGWRIAEIPVRYHPRELGESKISGSFTGTVRAGYGIIRMLVWLARLRRSARPRGRGVATLMPR